MASNHTQNANKGQGAKWITRHKRLAIYLRDGLACAYCGSAIEDGAKLTLDHLQCRHTGGSNHESNLVTCCVRCNSSRSDRSVAEFCAAVAQYLNHGITAAQIHAHIAACVARPLDVPAAKALIALRGGFTQALHQ